MNTMSISCGPSARQQTITSETQTGLPGDPQNRIGLFILLIILAIIGTSCRGETCGQNTAQAHKEIGVPSDSLDKPNVNVGRQLNSFLFNDSLRYPWYFGNDWFLRKHNPDDPILRSMMQRADPMETRFHRDAQKLRLPEKKS